MYHSNGMVDCRTPYQRFVVGHVAGGALGGVAGEMLNQGVLNYEQYGWSVKSWQPNVGALVQAGVLGGVTALGSAVGQWRYNRACFAAGTPLLTPEGSKPIEELRPGDLVLSRDEHNVEGPVEGKLVEEVFVRTGRVLNLHIRGRILGTTAEHPFFVRDRGWIPAGELAPGPKKGTGAFCQAKMHLSRMA